MFRISPAAHDYIEKKGAHITVYLRELLSMPGKDGAAPKIMMVPTVRLGKPDDNERPQYVPYEAGNITVWRNANLHPAEKNGVMEIGVEKILFTRHLTIKGA